jgi:hypothetical protein
VSLDSAKAGLQTTVGARGQAQVSLDSPEFKRAQAANKKVQSIDAQIEETAAVQQEVLALLGEGDTPNASGVHGVHGSNGWARAARELDLQHGVTRVDMPAADLIFDHEAMAAVTVNPSSGLTEPAYRAALAQKGQDRRYLYTELADQPIDNGDLAVTEFRQTGSRTVTGNIERDPVATTDKATLALAVELANESLSQFAAVVEDVPAKLFDVEAAFAAFLQSELLFQIERALDAHVLSQILAAAPPTGATGTGLIEQVRHAVAAMRALGANPTLLALNPTDAATLDLATTGADNAYVFATRSTGSSSPLWGLRPVEVPGLTEPTLIDPALLGVLYHATGTVMTDPYSGMKKNLVRIRAEVEGLFHVRDIAGAYVIDTTP